MGNNFNQIHRLASDHMLHYTFFSVEKATACSAARLQITTQIQNQVRNQTFIQVNGQLMQEISLLMSGK